MTFGIRLRIVDDWPIIRKKWSFIFNTIGTAILGYLTIAPDAITTAWAYLPEDIKAFVPVKYSLYIPLVLFVLGLLSQYIKQAKLRKEAEELKAKATQDGTN